MALDTALTILLAPLLVAQTVWTVRRAERLPEPDGPRKGRTGSGPKLRFLQIGDSSAVGVGVAHQADALAPKLAAQLGADYAVEWTLQGENGATTADALRLLEPVRQDHFDAAYVIFGVNDAKNLRPAHHWRRDYRTLIDTLKTWHGVQYVFVSGLPPVQEFPLIPNPLRFVLGLRARRFDRALRRLVTPLDGCVHLPLPAELNKDGIASDGFHPGAPIYAEWAVGAASEMRPHLAKLQMARPDHPANKSRGDNDQLEGQMSREA